jgi:signal transduction histidine kinase
VIATARRQAELEQPSGGLRVLGHELKNALSAASFHLDLLSGADGDALARDRIDAVRDAVAQALGLSEQLASEQPARPAGVELAAATRQCARLAGPAVERRGRLLAEIPERVGEIALDEVEARQLVLNLLLNAAEAIGPGGSVRLTLRPGRSDGGIDLEVSDDGIGMCAETLASACAPGVTSKPDGMGLGLFRVRELAEQAGGTLRIQSTAGAGTRVTLELPRIGRRSGR